MRDSDQTINEQIRKLKDMAMMSLGLHLTDQQLEPFRVYTAMLIDGNERMNLTPIIEPGEIMIKHYLDSMVFVKWMDDYYPQKKIRLADMGTGAGFPGIPIKILRPDIHVMLIDSLAKRINFLEHIITGLKLSDITLVTPGLKISVKILNTGDL
jgi:16S rRNA (guanine527-N7)-methyltransferase